MKKHVVAVIEAFYYHQFGSVNTCPAKRLLVTSNLRYLRTVKFKSNHIAFIFSLDSLGSILNPFKPNGFFHSYYLEKSILHFRGGRLIFSSLS